MRLLAICMASAHAGPDTGLTCAGSSSEVESALLELVFAGVFYIKMAVTATPFPVVSCPCYAPQTANRS